MGFLIHLHRYLQNYTVSYTFHSKKDYNYPPPLHAWTHTDFSTKCHQVVGMEVLPKKARQTAVTWLGLFGRDRVFQTSSWQLWLSESSAALFLSRKIPNSPTQILPILWRNPDSTEVNQLNFLQSLSSDFELHSIVKCHFWFLCIYHNTFKMNLFSNTQTTADTFWQSSGALLSLLQEGLLLSYNSNSSTKLNLRLWEKILHYGGANFCQAINSLENLAFQRQQTGKCSKDQELDSSWYQWGPSSQYLQHSSGDQNQPYESKQALVENLCFSQIPSVLRAIHMLSWEVCLTAAIEF